VFLRVPIGRRFGILHRNVKGFVRDECCGNSGMILELVVGATLASAFSVARATQASHLRAVANPRGIQNLLRVKDRGFSAESKFIQSIA
jgi:hypothetical protein